MAHPLAGCSTFSSWSSKNLALLDRLLVFSILFLACCPALPGQSPRIDLIEPSQGPIAGGTVVTIKGANFQGASLSVDEVVTAPQSLVANEIRFMVPRHNNGIASIKVASSGGAAYGEFLFVPPKLSELPPGYITTVAGIGQFAGYYRLATKAAVDPVGVAFDQKGITYIAEPGQNRVLRIRPDGILEPFAGTGISPDLGESVGDGGPAMEALINFPRGVAADPEGYVYIADQASRVRRVDARTGIITTIAGNGTRGFSGDGGLAKLARLNNVSHIATDAQGDIFFIDFDDVSGTPRIRKITLDGIISTVAGTSPPGFSGDGGPAIQAQLDFGPGTADFGGLAVDSQGNLYIADTGNRRIRRVDGRTGVITTVAGPNGPAGDGCLCNSSAITVDLMDNAYYYYNGGHSAHIVKMSPSGQTIAIYGKGTGFSEDGTPINEVLLGALISDLAIDPAGRVVYSDRSFRRVRRLNFTSGLLETVAGIGPRPIGESGPAIATVLNSCNGDIAFLPTGELLIGDPGNFLLRKVDRSGNISTVAGTGAALWDVRDEIPALQAFVAPIAVKTDMAGRIYLTDIESVYRIDSDGIMRRVAGRMHERAFFGDGGPALDALLCQPWDLILDNAGNLLIADTNNNRIRRVDAQTGIITTVGGSGPVNGSEHYGSNGKGAFCGDGGPALQACLNTPYGLAMDSEGDLFVADSWNFRIRKVDTKGIITTFVSNIYATKLIFDSASNLYIATNFGIWRFDPAGVSTRISGGLTPGFSGDGEPALQAQIRAQSQATGIAIDTEGNIFFLDSGNLRVRAIRFGAVLAPPSAQIQTIGGTPQSTPATTAFATPLEALVLDSSSRPAPGVRVDFSAPSSGPTCCFANGTNFIGIVTNRTGHASAVCTANAQQGTYSVTATPLTATAKIQFSLTNTPPTEKATLISPIGMISTPTPTYTWNAVAGASHYYLWVNDLSAQGKIKKWYTASEVGCSPEVGTCSIVPKVAIAAGAARWWIQTWNEAGYGPWSDGMSFSVNVGGPPPKASLVSPSGTITTSTPTYAWNAVESSTWYLLYANDSKTQATINQWYKASDAGCGSGICSVTPATVLASGACQWWIQTWNNSGTGPWSDGMVFNVQGGSPPGKATLVSPSGNISTVTPAYSWNAVESATWYLLYVSDSKTQGTINQWYKATDTGCGTGTGTCSVKPSTSLAGGKCQWWIQTYNEYGSGPWSDAMSFTVVSGTTGPYNIEFVTVTAGEFQMGSNTYSWEQPVHRVIISKPFQLGKYEITQAQWKAVMGSNPSHFTEDDNLPVERVSWGDAQAFIAKLNERNDGYRYGLPTEAEWEYACRAGTIGDYGGTGNLDEMGWYSNNSSNKTHVVGTKKANTWGIYDMHGNVWEWCQDWYSSDYYSSSPLTDPPGPASGSGRVGRGGGWSVGAGGCRSAVRNAGAPSGTYDFLGFRLLRTTQ